jgi:hypothetical protein
VTAYVNGLRTAGATPGSTTTRGHEPRDATTPRGHATSAWPPHRVAPHRSHLRATAALMTSGACDSTSLRRQGASSTRSSPSYTKSLAWTPSHVSGNRHRTFLCRVSPARRMTTGVSAGRRQTSHVVVHPRTPTRASEPDNNRHANEGVNAHATHHHSSGGRPRTWPRQPCCCAAVRSPQPPRSDVCESS